jgi:predicted dehydrogenase
MVASAADIPYIRTNEYPWPRVIFFEMVSQLWQNAARKETMRRARQYSSKTIMKRESLNRRQFLKQSTVLGVSLAAASGVPSLRSAPSPNEKIIIGVMGVHGRGIEHIDSFLSLPNTEVKYVCDVDSRAIEKGITAALKKQEKKPSGVTDFRRILDDKEVDVLAIAATNHWHAPATIWACAAGKHVYVEKPGSHNPGEAEWMVEAARKHNRAVQLGNQRRSWGWVREAVQRLHEGEIGRVVFARTWYNNLRPSIGVGKSVRIPDWLDYSLWQGPAPERPFKDNLIHYNWHWHWHWGNGELGNNGIHALDVARWGLGVDYPLSVTCSGGRYHYQDDQETPDTYVTAFDFGGKGATWESHSCHPHGFENARFGIHFYGEGGSLVIAGNDCRIYDLKGKVTAEIRRRGSDADHFANFLDVIRNGGSLNAEIAEGQKSAMLCHLGNIAYRTGTTLHLDAETHRVKDNKAAEALWEREYRSGWELKGV